MGTKAKLSVTHLADSFAVSGLPYSAALWKTRERFKTNRRNFLRLDRAR
jgi:hypothetical protein